MNIRRPLVIVGMSDHCHLKSDWTVSQKMFGHDPGYLGIRDSAWPGRDWTGQHLEFLFKHNYSTISFGHR